MNKRHQPNISNLKAEARRYRSGKIARSEDVSHSRALELVARRHGFFDWNTAVAHARTIPNPQQFSAGTHVSGRYMGREFEARVVSATRISNEETLVSLDLWEPVDVVESMHFSALRKRVSGVIQSNGCSLERLSNGIPQLEIVRGKDLPS